LVVLRVSAAAAMAKRVWKHAVKLLEQRLVFIIITEIALRDVFVLERQYRQALIPFGKITTFFNQRPAAPPIHKPFVGRNFVALLASLRPRGPCAGTHWEQMIHRFTLWWLSVKN